MIRRPKYTVREERTGYTVLMWLLIKKFTDRDVGSYKCVSTNSLGRADGTLRLYGELHDLAAEIVDIQFLHALRERDLRIHIVSTLSEIKIGFDRVGSRGKDHVSIIGGKLSFCIKSRFTARCRIVINRCCCRDKIQRSAESQWHDWFSLSEDRRFFFSVKGCDFCFRFSRGRSKFRRQQRRRRFLRK